MQTWRDAGFNVQGFADIDRMIWEKFLCNVTLSAPCAAFDVTVGELMANRDTWAVALGCMLRGATGSGRPCASRSRSTTPPTT